jgi:hypothetical protein
LTARVRLLFAGAVRDPYQFVLIDTRPIRGCAGNR